MRTTNVQSVLEQLNAYLDNEIEKIELFSRRKFFVKTTAGGNQYPYSDRTMSCDSRTPAILQTPPFTLSSLNEDDYSLWNSGDATPLNSNGAKYYGTIVPRVPQYWHNGDADLYQSRYSVADVVGRGRFRTGTGANNGDFQYSPDRRGLFQCRCNDCGGSVPFKPLARKKKSQAIDIVDPRTGKKIQL